MPRSWHHRHHLLQTGKVSNWVVDGAGCCLADGDATRLRGSRSWSGLQLTLSAQGRGSRQPEVRPVVAKTNQLRLQSHCRLAPEMKCTALTRVEIISFSSMQQSRWGRHERSNREQVGKKIK